MSAFNPAINEDRYLVLIDADDDLVELLTVICESPKAVADLLDGGQQ